MEKNENSHFLYPAALHVSVKPCCIHTILGSCIAVCIWDSVKKFGGMNHYMLPLWNGQGLASPKYGNIAIEKLIQKIESTGGVRKNMVAKIFGGAYVLNSQNKSFRIGERNIEIAISSLKEYKIPIIAQSVSGELGRKILYSTETGEVKMKFVEKNSY
jgi:chemotaxis protein CheD